MTPSPLEHLTAQLARLATNHDIQGAWPQKSIDAIAAAGAWTWIIPKEYGGLGLDPLSQLQAYEAVAAGCMTTALILTQRDAACEFIISCPDKTVRERWLPRLAAGELMTSVGISQLTTSRRSRRPAMAATQNDGQWVFTGFMPWVTGAKQCQMLVTGGVVEDGDQLLAMVPTDATGVTIDAPMQLMALQASQTCEVHCRGVAVDKDAVLRGPTDDVLASRSPIKPLVVAVTGIGLAGAMMQAIRHYAQREGKMPEDLLEELTARYDALRERLFGFADMLHRPDAEVPKSSLRTGVNDLLARLAAAVMIYAKGSGFLRQLDAQRLAREALFFMVWSAPDDVRANTLAALLDREPAMPKAMSLE